MERELHCTLMVQAQLQLLLEFCGPLNYTSLSGTHGNYLVTGLDCVLNTTDYTEADWRKI